MFRNPTSYFLLGLAIADLLTALVQVTVLATLYVFLYLQHPYSIKLTTLLNALQTFTEFYITTSNSTIFAFTLTQFSVVSSPLKYGRLVTRKKALSIVLAIYLCSGIIWFFQWYDILHRDYPVIQGYVFVGINISIFVMLHRAIRKKMARGLSRKKINTIAERGKHFHV